LGRQAYDIKEALGGRQPIIFLLFIYFAGISIQEKKAKKKKNKERKKR